LAPILLFKLLDMALHNNGPVPQANSRPLGRRVEQEEGGFRGFFRSLKKSLIGSEPARTRPNGFNTYVTAGVTANKQLQTLIQRGGALTCRTSVTQDNRPHDGLLIGFCDNIDAYLPPNGNLNSPKTTKSAIG
jgi:hypothetical protein